MTTAQDLLRTLAILYPTARFMISRYRPQSGAARRAIAAGADPAPLLLDVALAGEFHFVGAEHLSEIVTRFQCREDEVLALCSRVATDQHGGHLLLLDFAVPPSNEAQAEIERMIGHCDWRGWLLMSGASYHFIGSELFHTTDWRRQMARALLIPGIDHRCSAHALWNGFGGIRVTTCPMKPTLPYVVAEFGVPR